MMVSGSVRHLGSAATAIILASAIVGAEATADGAHAASGDISAPPASAAPARGQDATKPAAKTKQVEDVVVTANRQQERLHDAAVSASVLSGVSLKALTTSGQDIRFLAFKVPSLNIESSDGRTFPRLYIRGYGNTDFNAFASQPVSLVYDDVVQENPNLKGFPIFDVNNVEVLRGPQGTLFGRNAPAGVVSVQSTKPSLGRFGGYFNSSDGTYNTANFEGALNIPLSDKVAVRISAQEQHRDDWVTNSVNRTKLEGYNDFAGRGQLLYQPSSDFSALFNLHGRYLDGSARLFRANIIQHGTDKLVSGFDPATIFTDAANTQNYSGMGGNGRLTWDLGPVTLTSISGYEGIFNFFTRGDIDGGFGASYAPLFGPGPIPFAVATAGGIKALSQVSQEFRIQSNGHQPLSWLAGLYYFHENAVSDSIDYNGITGKQTDFSSDRQLNDAAAIFGSVAYRFTDRFQARAGIRYTYDHKTLNVIEAQNLAFNPSSAEAAAYNTSWDVSGTYKVLTNLNVYARVATGFRAPSFGPPGAFNGLQVANSEKNTSYETGFKSYLFHRRVSFDADFYYYDVRSQQLTAVGGVTNSTLLLNAKKTIGNGVEWDIHANIDDNLSTSLAGSYNFTRIEDPLLAVGVCGSCTVTNPLNASGNALINGNPLPQSAKYVVDWSVYYDYPLSPSTELFSYSDLSYRSKINFFLCESKEFVGQPLFDLGLRVGYRWGGGKYELAGFCRNCLNQVRIVGGLDFDNLTGFINDPVIAGAQLGVKF